MRTGVSASRIPRKPSLYGSKKLGRLADALISGHNIYHTADGSNYIRLGPKGVCPPGMYLDNTLGIYDCHAAGTNELAPANMTNQWHRAW